MSTRVWRHTWRGTLQDVCREGERGEIFKNSHDIKAVDIKLVCGDIKGERGCKMSVGKAKVGGFLKSHEIEYVDL